MADPPLVHSVSYENDEKQQSGADYMAACNAEFMKFGARGITGMVCCCTSILVLHSL
jgi:hypothetical protein